MATIKNQHLRIVRDYIMEHSSYTADDQVRGQFMRDMLRAVSTGNVHLFKELQQSNLILKYNYEEWYMNKYVLIIINKHSTTLQTACENGRISLIQYMLQHSEYDINYNKDPQGLTPLFHLIRYYGCYPEREISIETIMLMIQNGADPLSRYNGHRTMLDLKKDMQLQSDFLERIYLEHERKAAVQTIEVLYNLEHPLIYQLSFYEIKELIGYIYTEPVKETQELQQDEEEYQ